MKKKGGEEEEGMGTKQSYRKGKKMEQNLVVCTEHVLLA